MIPKQLKIGNLIATRPIIQGGMGIGISLSKLAAAVANEGGIGIISAANPGYREPDFYENPNKANCRALIHEIKKARSLAPKGIIGVNILSASQNYVDLVKAALSENIDLIISGAGLPKQLPELVQGHATKIVPIVSSLKSAETLLKLWHKRYQRTADAVVVEGPLAGGHLGFDVETLTHNPPLLADLVQSIKPVVDKYSELYSQKIPLIAGGGIDSALEAKKIFNAGADGIQIASALIPTFECDASDGFKQHFIEATEDHIEIVKSPVGLPGRALRSELTELIKNTRQPVKKCIGCLNHCNPAEIPYCITEALIAGVNGDRKNGLFFSGQNGYKTKQIRSVKAVLDTILE